MEILARTVLILLAVTVAATSFQDIGKKTVCTREEYAVIATVVYGLVGSGLVLWWPTPDVWSAIGKWSVLTSFAIDWAAAVILLRSAQPVKTMSMALFGCAYGLMWLGCAVFLWPA